MNIPLTVVAFLVRPVSLVSLFSLPFSLALFFLARRGHRFAIEAIPFERQ